MLAAFDLALVSVCVLCEYDILFLQREHTTCTYRLSLSLLYIVSSPKKQSCALLRLLLIVIVDDVDIGTRINLILKSQKTCHGILAKTA